MGQVYINSDGSIQGREDEILFDHVGIMTLAFWKNSSNYLTVFNMNDPEKNIQVEVPRG
jgi:hypothetical protein